MAEITTFLLIFSYLFMAALIPLSIHSQPTHTITSGQNLTDSERMVSANGVFTLGFFSPGKSKHRYLGMWYTKDEAQRVVWVANRLIPITNSSGVLTIGDDGRLKIKQSGGLPIVLNTDQAAKHNATATLLDSGNLVLTHMINDNGAFKRETVWQSFDHPSDTLLPGMKLAVNLKVGSNRSLTSWLSHEVPAPGAFTLGLDPTVDDSCQVVIWRRGIVLWTSGIWEDNSTHFEDWWNTYNVSFACVVVSKYEKYFNYTYADHSHLSRLVMGAWRQVKFNSFSEFAITLCEGRNPILSSGCVEEESKCGRHHRTAFRFKNKYMKRRAEYSDDDPNLGIADCDAKCKENCSCIAYASAHKNGTGCHFWLQNSPPVEGAILGLDAYVSDQELNKGSNCNWISYAIVIILVPTMLYSVICCSYTKSKIAPGNEIFHDDFVHELDTDGSTSENTSKKCAELQRFSFSDITVATKNFSSKNKLGEGGFGPVYKGKLSEGQEIAVKRLSRGSVQGLLEFKNEIALISKLQHTNLVKLLGYCIDREEKMLIYEYMPNKSLDFFIFDPTRKELLDWKKRFSIIEGIAQGLLYLHKFWHGKNV
eukprot:XP_019081909.1 PREDICTED: G-type lectin S-receptor-like serine/threonine-protein kinase CES101 isoform X2 [Vitis vinifera]